MVEDNDVLRKKLVSFDLWKNQHVAINVDKVKKESCLSCGSNPTYPYLAFSNQTKTAVFCERDTVQIRPPKPMERNLESLANTLLKQ